MLPKKKIKTKRKKANLSIKFPLHPADVTILLKNFAKNKYTSGSPVAI